MPARSPKAERRWRRSLAGAITLTAALLHAGAAAALRCAKGSPPEDIARSWSERGIIERGDFPVV